MSKPWVTGFHDPVTGTVTYVVADPMQRRAAVVDPVWDFDPKSARLSTTGVDRVSAFLDREDLSLEWILETHVHADHLSAAQILKHRFGAPIGIGRQVAVVQETFAAFYNIGREVPSDGSQFDRLFDDGGAFPSAGSRRACCTRRDTRRPASPTSWMMPVSSATRSSCPTPEPRAAISRAEMRGFSIVRFTAF